MGQISSDICQETSDSGSQKKVSSALVSVSSLAERGVAAGFISPFLTILCIFSKSNTQLVYSQSTATQGTTNPKSHLNRISCGSQSHNNASYYITVSI